MTVRAKICGLSTPETVRAAADGGASHIGFNFFPKSPRYVELEAAAILAQPARARGVKIVAVTVDPDDAMLDRLMATLKPDLVQLHGKETPARAHQAAERTGVGIIKALPVSDASDVAAAGGFEPVVEHLMFDARPPEGSDLPGGVGASFDWSMMQGRSFRRDWFLAGGLTPDNAARAAANSGAPLLDVSSGVESAPGVKDPARIAAFLKAVA